VTTVAFEAVHQAGADVAGGAGDKDGFSGHDSAPLSSENVGDQSGRQAE
jgi:hypothetical protein